LTSRILEYLSRHALAAAAFVCSILALAGSSYAAFSISGSQIRNRTIDPIKFNPRLINGSVRAWAIVAPNGTVIRGRGGPKVTPQLGDPGGYQVRWSVKFGRCATEATVDSYASPTTPVTSTEQLPDGFALAASAGRPSRTAVQTFDKNGAPTNLAFDVAVIC
jgi:hypothetical protein